MVMVITQYYLTTLDGKPHLGQSPTNYKGNNADVTKPYEVQNE